MTGGGVKNGFRAALVLALLTTAPGSPCLALDDNEAVDAAREGLAGPEQFPWYDKQADDVRRIDVESPPPPPKAGDWEGEEAKPTAPRPRTRSSMWSMILELLLYLAYGVLIAVLLAVIVLLVAGIGFAENSYVLPPKKLIPVQLSP